MDESEKISIRQIEEAMKKFINACENCNHNKTSHQKVTVRDKGRSNLKSIGTSDSKCNKSGCDCREFKSK